MNTHIKAIIATVVFVGWNIGIAIETIFFESHYFLIGFLILVGVLFIGMVTTLIYKLFYELFD